MEEPSQNFVLIELHVPDFKKVKDYYQKLSFEVVWEREPEVFKGYLVMKMGGNILCFWAGNDDVHRHPYFKKMPKASPLGYGVEIVAMVDDIDAYYEKIKGSVNIVGELQTQPWGLKDFRVADPFGFYLRFTEKHNILDPKYAVP